MFGLLQLASASILLGTVCVTAAIFVVPLIFNQVQRLESELQNEMEFCGMRATMFAQELSRASKATHGRPKRGDDVSELDTDAKRNVYHVVSPLLYSG